MWFEDIALNVKSDIGEYMFTEENIVAFAKQYDPQPMHTDPEAAKASIWGGLIASGWHVACVWMSLVVPWRAARAALTGADATSVSPGLRELRWLKPVRPGMILIYSTEPTVKRDWPTRPNLGLLESKNEARDADGVVYMTFIGRSLIAKRPTQ